MSNTNLPKLITFDGEARSGKGTVVQALKDYIRDNLGYKVMLIDAGQVFRSLVVAATKAQIDLDNSSALDEFLRNDESAESCVRFVKEVYHMDKASRDKLLYTNSISANSAKVGARPLAQSFKDKLLKKWLRDAALEAYEIVLLDGRALEETGTMLESENLCTFVAGFYFVCEAQIGARRTLGYASKSYADLSDKQRLEVDELVAQITVRNQADRERTVQPIVEPTTGMRVSLPAVPVMKLNSHRTMLVIDTSNEMSKQAMIKPMLQLTTDLLNY